jgi:hypothetical protein
VKSAVIGIGLANDDKKFEKKKVVVISHLVAEKLLQSSGRPFGPNSSIETYAVVTAGRDVLLRERIATIIRGMGVREFRFWRVKCRIF